MAHIVSIAYTPADIERRPKDYYARTPLESAVLVASHGINGDRKATRGKRQLNIMFAEQVAELRAEGFRAAPGELGEQIVVAGLPVDGVSPGTHLKLGDGALVILDELRTGCGRLAHIQGKPAAAAAGRLGYMARVLAGGPIAVGSPVAVEVSVAPASARAS
jgi:MOSC domain-containing protein YiiM